MLDHIRIACAVPRVQVANVKKNTDDICALIARADERKVDVLVFPELAITGYTCADLFFQQLLHEATRNSLQQIVACSGEHPGVTAVVGLPLMLDGQLYNCAAVVSGGAVRGIVPKTYIPNENEFSEKRWFASAVDLRSQSVEACALGLEGAYAIPVGQGNVFTLGDVKLGVEICEDLWAPVPPSSLLAVNGAEMIVNLAASNETVGKRTQRIDRIRHQSETGICCYAFCSAGCTESTQDLVFSGHSVVALNGQILAQNEKLIDTDYMLVTDVDLGIIRADRCTKTSFRDAAAAFGGETTVKDAGNLRGDGSLSKVSRLPFVPEKLEDLEAVFQIQTAGLKHRLETINAKVVIGVSGGLDSTLALLVAVEAMRQLGRPMTDIWGVTMPCFGTSDRTYQNAWELMRKLGIRCKEINIRDAVTTHFRDIGHDPEKHDTTYENAQARERTQILMDFAGEVGGIVVGTGDMSELALGWCTYNGDHMSMYGVNSSVPKTLVRWVIDAVAKMPAFAAAQAVLQDILDTPISPELLPPDASGRISQQTEDIVGPYVLHDFFLYYMLRYGYTPAKIYTLACMAFDGEFDRAVIKKWLVVFYRRFFSQQFKRNCQPDGVKTGCVGVSPRGDLMMPSDASAALWVQAAENL